jgi:hypothetical protein
MLRKALLFMQKISGYGPLDVTLDSIEAHWRSSQLVIAAHSQVK